VEDYGEEGAIAELESQHSTITRSQCVTVMYFWNEVRWQFCAKSWRLQLCLKQLSRHTLARRLLASGKKAGNTGSKQRLVATCKDESCFHKLRLINTMLLPYKEFQNLSISFDEVYRRKKDISLMLKNKAFADKWK